MPVTARLSRKFYDTFGDEIANELVEWFNQVDAQYKSELKELAEGYFQRFQADLRAEIGTLRGGMESLRTDTSAELRTGIAGLRAEMLKWMFVFWIGTVGATVGIVFAAISFSR